MRERWDHRSEDQCQRQEQFYRNRFHVVNKTTEMIGVLKRLFEIVEKLFERPLPTSHKKQRFDRVSSPPNYL